ncbi:MAG: choice-of-anchor D domain-containing protein, partial [Acidobacteriota bacterium]|nr:choice-of-anchor D domain-containing protein [Acidobacteriota bacterium]
MQLPNDLRTRAFQHGAENRRAAFSIPTTFEPNIGQFDPRVKYAGRGEITVLLTRSGVELRVPSPAAGWNTDAVHLVRMRVGWDTQRGARGRRDLNFDWRGEQRVETVSNYFVGRDRRKWHPNVPHFARAVGEAKAGAPLRLAVYGTGEGIEYDLRLAPGEDASKVRLHFSGADQIELSRGDVILRAGGRIVRMAKPNIFIERPGRARAAVAGEYAMDADGAVGFKIAAHDPRAALVIDPSISVGYATFLGGTGDETAGNVAIDSIGNVYVSGVTASATTFPEANGTSLGGVTGASAFYVAKINPALTGANSLLYLTFLGGSGTQSGGLIALDRAGDVALTGTTTSLDFPVTGTSQPTIGLTSGKGNDAVVSEINAQGNQLKFSGYFGGSGKLAVGGPGGIAVDQAGNIYIAAEVQPTAADTAQPDLPVTAGALQPIWDVQSSDAFLAVFAPPTQTGAAPTLTYCTYLGTNSTGQVGIGGVAVDSNGNAYIAGSTSNSASGFPVLRAFQSGYGGGTSDGFVMKIAPKGQGTADLVYATLLGGSDTDEILGIALDSSIAPKAYVTGETRSINFPVTASAYQSKLSANLAVGTSSNTFLAVIAQDAVTAQTSLGYSTYLGGSGTDAGLAVAVSATASVYVAGETNSPDFPWHDNLQPFNGAEDAFLAKFDPASSGAASLIYSTPLAGTSPPGGSVAAGASGVTTNGAGQVYVTGQTSAADFPTAITTAGAENGFQQTCASCQATSPANDAFLLAIAENSTGLPSVYFNLGSENFGAANLGTQVSGQPLAVLNGGEQNLTITNVQVAGPNASDFSPTGQTACIGASIPPGPVVHCSIDVTFTPSAGGPEAAFLEITDNAPGSPQLLELKGSGNAPHAQVLPASLSFGNQPVNTVSPGRTITITNTGSANLTLSGELIAPAGAPFQPQAGSCSFPQSGWTLAPGSSCTIAIAFAPTATGAAQGQLQITDNSDLQSNAEQVVTLSGTGVTNAPIAQINPSSVTFGSTLIGATSAAQTVTLQNTGSAALNLTGISIGGTNAADFKTATSGSTCPATGGTVAAGAQCTVAVQFAPQSTSGSKTATLDFADNAAPSPQTVALNGTATVAATLTVTPATLSFGAQSEGTTSAAQAVTIANSGSIDAGITGLAIGGSSDFVQQNACPPILTAGAHCQVSVTFAPAEAAAPGARSGTLQIPGGTPASVSLSGTATQAAISFTTGLNFASQLVGTASTPQAITITNSSTGPLAGALAFAGIAIGGTNKADFSITANQCAASGSGGIAPGSSCTVQVAFDPQPAATCGDSPNRGAVLQLQDNAPGSPQ